MDNHLFNKQIPQKRVFVRRRVCIQSGKPAKNPTIQCILYYKHTKFTRCLSRRVKLPGNIQTSISILLFVYLCPYNIVVPSLLVILLSVSFKNPQRFSCCLSRWVLVCKIGDFKHEITIQVRALENCIKVQ